MMDIRNCFKAVAAMIGPMASSALAACGGKVVFGELFTPASGWALDNIEVRQVLVA
jgi:peptide/nickel transport system substrate-binding protein